MPLELKRPLALFDLETTCADPATARVVEIAVVRLNPDGSQEEWVQRINPEEPISPGAIAVHGITDADVADQPTFAEVSAKIRELFRDADIAGYNSTRFDVPVLLEEFGRIGEEFDVAGRAFLDAMIIFTKHEPRTLTAAYKKFCGKELVGAHGALADVLATKEVLMAQMDYYDDLPDNVPELGKYCLGRDHADLVGRLAYDDDGEVVYKFGKYKGRRVKDIFEQDPSYLDWILRSNFPTLTKRMLLDMYNQHRLQQ